MVAHRQKLIQAGGGPQTDEQFLALYQSREDYEHALPSPLPTPGSERKQFYRHGNPNNFQASPT